MTFLVITTKYLNASIFCVTSVNSNKHCTHVRSEVAIFIPVAIVLVPLKHSTSVWLFSNQFAVIMKHLLT